jgi:hypothetical protein
MQENDDAERPGRESWMQGRMAFEDKIKRFSARVLAHAANGNVSFSEWEYYVDVEGMEAMKIVQVSVRPWRRGRSYASGFTINDLSSGSLFGSAYYRTVGVSAARSTRIRAKEVV